MADTETDDILAGIPPLMEDKPKRGRPAKLANLSDELTEEDISAIRLKAKERVAREIRESEEERLLAEFEDEERVAKGLAPLTGAPRAKSFMDVTISLPEFSPYLSIDGARFYHGHTYRVSGDQAQFLLWQMQPSWFH